MKPLGKPTSEAERTAETAFQNLQAWNLQAWQGQEIFYEPGPAAVVSPIHRAVDSHCYRVRVQDQLYFAKLRQADMRDFFDDSAVAANCRIASDAGVSPKLFAADPAVGLLVYEHLSDDWTWCKVDDLANGEVLANVVDAKKALHEGTAFSATFDVFATIAGYLRQTSSERITVPSDVPAIAEAVREIGEAIAASGIERRPCHADGVASNIMLGPERSVRLVDFDRAGNCDPYFDLGSLMLEAFQFEEDERRILEIYEGACRQAAYHRCKLYGAADDLMWALWGFISFHHSPRKEVEFTKYAEWRLLRARWTLGSPGFSTWLRNLG
ncbi:MAG: phosphotransferase [Kiloniellales bacterium]